MRRLPNGLAGSFGSRQIRLSVAPSLLTTHSAAPTTNIEAKERAHLAAIGALVADASSMPLHWIYDVPKMQLLLKNGNLSSPFFPELSCPYYKAKAVGDQSPYGYELFPLASALAQCKESSQNFDPEVAVQHLVTFFTSDERKESVYRNQSVRMTLENYEKGKRGIECGHDKDHQANCFAKASILVAKYGSESPEQLAAVAEKVIRCQQNNDDAVKYGVAGALILQRVCHGSSIVEALKWGSSKAQGLIKDEIKTLIAQALFYSASPPTEIVFDPIPAYMTAMYQIHIDAKDSLEGFQWPVWCIGPACGNPAALTNVLMIAAAYSKEGSIGKVLSDGGERYKQGVISNLMAGGDNCSRSLLLGALLAAEGGSVPADWIKKTTEIDKVRALIKS